MGLFISTVVRLALVGSAITMVAAPANAATFNLELFGRVDDGQYSTFTSSGTQFRTYSLDLGFDGFELSQGDIVNIAFDFDRLFDIPQFNDFGILGFDFIQVPITFSNKSSSQLTFLDGGLSGTTIGTFSDNSISLAGVIPASASPFSFSQLVGSTEVVALSSPQFVNQVQFRYQLNDAAAAVPEASTWAMMIVGFGAIGGAMRRRQRNVAATVRYA